MKGTVRLVASLIVIFAAGGMAMADETQDESTNPAPFGEPIQDGRVYTHVLFDEFEGRFGANNSFRWEGEAWTGTDTNRLWFKSEGETTGRGGVEDGQQELFYDRPISRYFDVQAGMRSDLDSRAGRNWAALGVEGLAPMFFQLSVTAYASSEAHYAAKVEGSYDLPITQRLILQPQIEVNFYSKDDPTRAVGSGLSDIDTGLRLRYEFIRKFAPYIAVTYQDTYGTTADFARAEGERPSQLRFTAGVRIWL